ncbi:MAG: secretin N-terminal domain-containing protein [Deltaproteobacteria bacterium]
MKRSTRILMMTAFLFAGAAVPAVPAQEVSAPASAADAPASSKPAAIERLPGGMEGFISLDLRGIDVVDALKYLATKANLDIVTTPNVAGRVTLMVENVPVQDVFDAMLRSNDLAYDRQGDIYSVMTQEEYLSLYGKPFADTRKVELFRLNYAIPEQAFSLLDTIKSDIGRVLVDTESGSALVIDIPEKIRQMRQALESFERKNEIRIFPLQYAKAKDVEEYLKTQLDNKKVGLVKADERGNQVMVQTLPYRMKEIERLIKELDTKTREVMIETTIVKIKLTDENTSGVSWEGLFDTGRRKGLTYIGSTPFATVNPSTTAGDFMTRKDTWYYTVDQNVGSYPFSGTTSDLSGSTKQTGLEELHVGMVTAQDFDFLFKYVQSLGSTRILANPKLLVTNNQESRIHVGERQAYVTTTTTTGQVSNTVAEDVTFVDVGIQLSVTPEINDEGYVTMKIKAEISSVTSTLVTPTENKIPIIDTSLAETTVMAKEGTTIVLGGLRRDEVTETKERTPFFSSLPWIGSMFKSSNKKTDRTELMILLTPHIISGDVLVTPQGKSVEYPGIKDMQEYDAGHTLPPSVGSLREAQAQEKPVIKGLRASP